MTGYELIFQLLFVISILVKLYRHNISFMPMLESMFYLLLNCFLPVHKKTSNKSLRAIFGVNLSDSYDHKYLIFRLFSYFHSSNQQHTHTHLMALFPGLPGWAGTRKVKPVWILLKQESVSGSGISWAMCKSAPSCRQITMPAPHHSVFVQAGCPSCCPTNSVKALKATSSNQQLERKLALKTLQQLMLN